MADYPARPTCGSPDACIAKRADRCCRPCTTRWVARNPAFAEKREAAIRAAKAGPEHSARQAKNKREWHASQRDDPAYVANMQAAGRYLRSRMDAAPPERKAAHAATVAEVCRRRNAEQLAWCRDEYLAAYHQIRRKRGVTAADARRMIEDQIAVDTRHAEPTREPAQPAQPTAFERQLARVAAGAGLVAVRPIRKVDPAGTLGGIATAMIG